MLPLAPKSRSSIFEPPPSHYGGEILQSIFRTNEKRAKALIPPHQEIGTDLGKAIVWLLGMVSVSESNPNLAFVNPEQAVYQE